MEQENLSPWNRRSVEMGEAGPLAARGRTPSGRHRKGQSTARHRGGTARMSDEGPVMGSEQRGRAGQIDRRSTPLGDEPTEGSKPKAKSFEIRKRLVYEAWMKVQANDGAPGVDAVSTKEFAANERGERCRRRPGRPNRVSSPASNSAVESPPVRPGPFGQDGSRNCFGGRSAPASPPAASLLRSGRFDRPCSAPRAPSSPTRDPSVSRPPAPAQGSSFPKPCDSTVCRDDRSAPLRRLRCQSRICLPFAFIALSLMAGLKPTKKPLGPRTTRPRKVYPRKSKLDRPLGNAEVQTTAREAFAGMGLAEGC